MTIEHQPVRWEKVYVFISSTFGDMHAERDYLVKRVFPELQDWCERRRLRLVDIDLRWGVTEADTTSKRAVEVCLERINDCRPFFLCFLGQRHGWMPKPTDVADSTLEKFPALREALQTNASVTELEIRHAILKPFRSTAPEAKHPQPDIAEHAFFYFRDAGYLNDLQAAPRQLRCTFTDDVGPDDETDDERQQRERARDALRTLREATIPQDRPVIYQAGWRTELTTPELTMPLECTDEWRQKWNRFAHLDLANTDERIPAEKLAAANEYNAALTRGRLSNFRLRAAPDTELAAIIQHDLQAAIEARFPTHTEVAQETDQQKELDQQDGFLQACSEGFIKRTGDFDQLDGYVADESNKLFVLTAPGGMGKSTLLAKWIDRARTRLEAHPEQSLHFRFIGASDRSTTVYSLLRSLLGEMLATKKLDQEIPADPNKLREALPELLAAIGKRGKTVIVLDALNQLESGLQDLHWLPRTLPANIKLIVSFKRDDDASEQVYQQFHAAQAILSEVKPFANLDDRRRLVTAYLQQYLKELDEAHIAALIATAGASNPLYLKVVLSELRVFGAFAGLAEKIRRDFGDNTITAFQGVLRRLESDPAYAPIEPQRAVPLLFGLLAHARHGLSVEELTSLFVQALKLEDNEQGRQAAADTINLLLRQVRPFLARREGRYDYFYESFKTAAQQHCAISEAEPSATGWSAPQFHQLLAGLFTRQADPSGNRQWDGDAPRALRDLPYHLLEGKQSEELFRVAREEVFLTAQKRSFPDEPELYLQTIQAAIEGAARIDDAARMAEFVLAHARRLMGIMNESPLEALRAGNLQRAWELADLHPIETGSLWHLLLAWELHDQSRPDAARATLERLQAKQLVPVRWDLIVELLRMAAYVSPEATSVLQQRLVDVQEHRKALCQRFCSDGQFLTAIATAGGMQDHMDRALALAAIGAAQAGAGELAEARTTLAAARSSVQAVTDKNKQTRLLAEIAAAQAQSGEAEGSRATFAVALQVVGEIENVYHHSWRPFFASDSNMQGVTEKEKIDYQGYALKDIASAQARAGDIPAALETALRIEGEYARSNAQGKIAETQVQIGDLRGAFATIQKIADRHIPPEALVAIAIAQARIGDFAAARKSLLRTVAEGYGAEDACSAVFEMQARAQGFSAALSSSHGIADTKRRAWALVGVAKAQVEAGETVAAMETARAIDEDWPRADALRAIAVAQAWAGNFTDALDIAAGIEEEWLRAKAMSETTVAQDRLGSRREAEKTLTDALEWIRRMKDDRGRRNVLKEIASTQSQAGAGSLARTTLSAAIDAIDEFARDTHGWEPRDEALEEIAMAQAQGDDSDLAMDTARAIGPFWRAGALAKVARSQVQVGKEGLAQASLAAALEAVPEIHFNTGEPATESQGDVLQEIGVVQYQLGDLEAARITFAAALTKTSGEVHRGWCRAKEMAAVASAHARAGDFSTAILTAHSIDYAPSRKDALLEIAAAQTKAGEVETARKTLTEAASATLGIHHDGYREEKQAEVVAAMSSIGDFDSALKITRRIKSASYWGRAIAEIVIAQARFDQIQAARKTLAAALETAPQFEYPINALVEIAVAQAKVGEVESAHHSFAAALDVAQKDYEFELVATAQARAGFGEAAVRTANLILSNRNCFLPKIAAQFASAEAREHFKRLLIQCAPYLDSAYRMCGLLARLYPEQATAVAAVVTSAV